MNLKNSGKTDIIPNETMPSIASIIWNRHSSETTFAFGFHGNYMLSKQQALCGIWNRHSSDWKMCFTGLKHYLVWREPNISGGTDNLYLPGHFTDNGPLPESTSSFQDSNGPNQVAAGRLLLLVYYS
jgi:hypothetical protein